MEPIDLRDLVAFSEDAPTHRSVAESDHLWSELICLDLTQSVGPIGDRDSDALCTIVAGRVVAQIGKSRKRLGQWEAVLVPAGSPLTLTNAGEDPSVVLIVAAPPPTARTLSG